GPHRGTCRPQHLVQRPRRADRLQPRRRRQGLHRVRARRARHREHRDPAGEPVMGAQPPGRPGQVLVMAKPDGHARPSSAAGIRLLYGCWADLLSWLQGTDPDDLEHAAVVAAVAEKAALRMPRYSAYDIATWTAHARDIPVPSPEHPGPAPLIQVAGDLLASLGFTGTGQYTGWLNRVTIEL